MYFSQGKTLTVNLLPVPIIQEVTKRSQEEGGTDEHCDAVDRSRFAYHCVGKFFEILGLSVSAISVHYLTLVNAFLSRRWQPYLHHRLTHETCTPFTPDEFFDDLRSSGVIQRDLLNENVLGVQSLA